MLRKMLCVTFGAATLAAVSFAPLAAMAEDQNGANAAIATEVPSDSAVAQAALAQDLFALAQKTKNPVAALAAAQIMNGLELKDVDREKETKANDGPAVTEEGTGVDTPIDGAAMLAAAKMFAGGDPAVLGLIEDTEAEGSRGRIGGASRTLSRLPGGKTDVFKVPFYGGRLAELAIVGDGDANLDLLVTDAKGNAICVDRSYSDKLYCSWTPRWDGHFYVAVVNQGRIRNSYYILTN